MKDFKFEFIDKISLEKYQYDIILPKDTVFYKVFSLSNIQEFYVAIWEYDKYLYDKLVKANKSRVYKIGDFIVVNLTNCRMLEKYTTYDIDKLNEDYFSYFSKYVIYHKDENPIYNLIKQELIQYSFNPTPEKESKTKELTNELKKHDEYIINELHRPFRFSGNENGLSAIVGTINIKHNAYIINEYDVWQIANTYFNDCITDDEKIIDMFNSEKKRIFEYC